MANEKRNISNSLKKKLYNEAGGKCANPGCANVRTEIHHIREWHIYKTHDEKYMIAVCPTCHDAIHNNKETFTDDNVLDWKGISRGSGFARTHLYIEPKQNPIIMLGSIAATTESSSPVIDLGGGPYLNISVEDREILLLDVRVMTFEGLELLSIRKGYGKHKKAAGIQLLHRPGLVRVAVPKQIDLVPSWAQEFVEESVAKLKSPKFTSAIELETIRPGVVRVQGVWASTERVVVVNKSEVCIAMKNGRHLTITGQGEETIVMCQGSSITGAVFHAFERG